MRNYDLTLGSLFSGSGGFELAGLLSGIVPLWNSELEPFPIRVTSKRLPFLKHYGDIRQLNGSELPPVDIITFGSPCQDMSIAGKREGLTGERSSLFHEAIRVIAEMRKATNEQHPRYIVWENVPGAFSSNGGNDFRKVLEEVCRLKEETVSVSKPDKWANAGLIVGDGYSLCWRVLDAQFFGVPQRRKRIYLVADLGGGRAEQILFESEGVRRDFTPSFAAGKTTAGSLGDCAQKTGCVCLNDQGGRRMDITEDVTCTLRAESTHPPSVLDAPKMYENHSQDTRFVEANDCSPSLSANMGLGGNNTPFVVNSKPLKVFGICSKSSNSMLSDNPKSGFYEAETARTLDSTSNAPGRNQGGMAVIALEGNGARPSHQGSGFSEDGKGYTLNSVERHGIAYGLERAVFNQGKNAKFDFKIEEEIQAPILAQSPSGVAQPVIVDDEPQYIVRKLTPTECARLQGFPDWWCKDLDIENPCEEELEFWREVFDCYCAGKKKRTDKQILKWLKSPHTDTAEYKMWGNGIALPCAVYVLKGICE